MLLKNFLTIVLHSEMFSCFLLTSHHVTCRTLVLSHFAIKKILEDCNFVFEKGL